jgi:hypothetical protein
MSMSFGRLGAALAALFGAAAALFASTPASAEKSTPYQEFAVITNGPRPSRCNVVFREVPAASRFDIRNISCQIELQPTGDETEITSVRIIILPKSGTPTPGGTLIPVLISKKKRTYAINDSVRLFADQGAQVQIAVSQTTDFPIPFINCFIGGEMVTSD